MRPHEVHLAQEARKIQKAALLNNFADREAERPALGPDDFLIAAGNHILAETAYEGRVEQPKKKQRSVIRLFGKYMCGYRGCVMT